MLEVKDWPNKAGEPEHAQGRARRPQQYKVCSPSLAGALGVEQHGRAGCAKERHLSQVDVDGGRALDKGMMDSGGELGRGADVDLPGHPDEDHAICGP
jgi:hypothetical protein